MKILIIHNKHKFHGGEETFVELQKKAHRINQDEIFMYMKDSGKIEFSNPIFLIYTLLTKSFFSIQTYYDIKKIIRLKQPGIVFIHNIHPLISGSAYYALRRAKVPIIQVIHNYNLLSEKTREIAKINLRPSWKKLYMIAIRSFSSLFFFKKSKITLGFYSHFLMKQYELAPINKNKVFLTTPISTISPTYLQQNSKDKSKSYILYLGRFSAEKGITDILKLAKNLKEEHFILAGNGEMLSFIKKTIEKESLSNIKILPFQRGRMKWELLNKAKLVIVPSIWDEPFGLTLLESIISKTPTIISNSGAMPEIIKNIKTCFIYEKSDISLLKQKIKYINNNYSKILKNSQESKYRILSKYSDKNYIKDIKKIMINYHNNL